VEDDAQVIPLQGALRALRRAGTEVSSKQAEDALKAMGAELRQRFLNTKMALRSISGEGAPHLLSSQVTQNKSGPDGVVPKAASPVQAETSSVNLRNALIMPLNLMQVRCLKETRDFSAICSQEAKQLLEDTLLISVKGISAGLQNTG